MTLKGVRFVLAVPDLAASAAFYQDVLGFEIREFVDHSYYGYFEIEDIDLYYQQVVARKVEVLKSLVSEPWGMREFAIRTIDGHRIMFGQNLD